MAESDTFRGAVLVAVYAEPATTSYDHDQDEAGHSPSPPPVATLAVLRCEKELVRAVADFLGVLRGMQLRRVRELRDALG